MPSFKPKALIEGDEVSEGFKNTKIWEKGKRKKRKNLFYNREEQHRNARWRGVSA